MLSKKALTKEEKIRHECQVLGVNIANCNNEKKIKKAYHKLCLHYHPDKCSSNYDKEKFLEIMEANETLNAYLKEDEGKDFSDANISKDKYYDRSNDLSDKYKNNHFSDNRNKNSGNYDNFSFSRKCEDFPKGFDEAKEKENEQEEKINLKESENNKTSETDKDILKYYFFFFLVIKLVCKLFILKNLLNFNKKSCLSILLTTFLINKLKNNIHNKNIRILSVFIVIVIWSIFKLI